jgi:hypothetical protein
MELLIGAGLIIAGYLLCYFTVKKPTQLKEAYTEIKRVKPNFRNPTKTYDVGYDKFKTNGLYGPVKPKGGDS